jgi:hypothetical protein
MDERARRIGENEALFRHLNERVEQINRSFSSLTNSMNVVCECGDIACLERFDVSIPVYEQVRAEPTHFFALPGHEIPEVEEIVISGDGYNVIAKLPGGPAELARETAPRSGN